MFVVKNDNSKFYLFCAAILVTNKNKISRQITFDLPVVFFLFFVMQI